VSRSYLDDTVVVQPVDDREEELAAGVSVPVGRARARSTKVRPSAFVAGSLPRENIW